MAKTQPKKKKIREGINKANHSMNMGKNKMSLDFVTKIAHPSSALCIRLAHAIFFFFFKRRFLQEFGSSPSSAEHIFFFQKKVLRQKKKKKKNRFEWLADHP